MQEQKRFTRNFTKKHQISSHLYCPICLDIFDFPLRAPCGQFEIVFRHTYCCRCIYQWMELNKSCPVCKQKIKSEKTLDKDIIPEKIVADLQVKCENKKCNWKGRNQELRAHFVKCEHRKTQKQQFSSSKNVILIGEDENQNQLIDLDD